MTLAYLDKPRVFLLKDEYALGTGKHWCCSGSIFCARGCSPEEAYEAYTNHLREIREVSRNISKVNNYRSGELI